MSIVPTITATECCLYAACPYWLAAILLLALRLMKDIYDGSETFVHEAVRPNSSRRTERDTKP